ncbi:extracellular solute-binding protein [Gorillibacterium sp. sgz5001074]|uniref:extracellular solute-binding protein n=1 Tax=Gorillibacterium sp. sgz5001074 TaxID=3446695 RepID=UPI003F67BB8B
MNANMKKALMLSTTVALTVGLTAGCGSDKSTDASSTAGASAGTKSTAAPTPKEKKEVTVEVLDRGAVPPEEGTIDKNRWTEWINANGPHKITFVPIPFSGSADKVNVLLASGSAPDILNETNANFRNQLYTQKQALALDDLIAKNSTEYKKLLEQYPGLKKLATRPDGKMYEMGRISAPLPSIYWFIREDWLKKLNLEMPKTTDDLYKVAKAFVENDPDGNGKKDTLGMAFSNAHSHIALDTTFGNVEWALKDGQMVRDWDNALQLIKFKKKLFEEGLVDKDYLTDKNGDRAKQDFMNGRLGIYALNNDTTMLNTLFKNVPTADVNILPLPKSPAGQFNMIVNPPYQLTTMINRSAKNPEAAIEFLDFLIKENTSKVLRGYDEASKGTVYNLNANGCPVNIDSASYAKKYYTSALRTLASDALMFGGKCNSRGAAVDKDKEPKIYKAWQAAEDVYMNPSFQMPHVTHPEWMPTLPKDLQLIVDNVGSFNNMSNSKLYDLEARAIVDGAKYSPEQAIADAKELWSKAGGAKVEEFYKTWYAENKDKALLTKDIYEAMKKMPK